MTGDSDPLCGWQAFAGAVEARLQAGRLAYGDKSFQRPPQALIGEVEQELFDVAAWSFILWTRLRRLKAVAGSEVVEPHPTASDAS